jgi:hypothetical protein
MKIRVKVCSPVPTTSIAGAFDNREQLIAGVGDNGDKHKGAKYCISENFGKNLKLPKQDAHYSGAWRTDS